MTDIFLSRQPVLNGQSRAIATRLTLHASGAADAHAAAQALAGLVDVWPAGERIFFIDGGSLPVDAAWLDWPVPANAVLELGSATLLGPKGGEFVAALQSVQPALCLKVDAQVATALASGLQYRFVALDARHLAPAGLSALAAQLQLHGIVIALNVFDREVFKACLDAGINAVASWFFKQASAHTVRKPLNPGQAQIVRVLNLVRKNADVKEVEAALKQDVALSYKLLRYINSAGFGLSCEIQSFRHAVTILGYDKLNKWLSLLLVTASKDPMAPALMHAALTRARLMESLGHGLVDPQEYDNLFITGAFSMLDVLLGVSMETVLESMSLPEAICDALLGQGGLYAPFLDLACISEGEDGPAIAELAGQLGLSAESFNRAQLQALAFADAMAQ
ncbi:EAL and HDOD domain-containing protein [Propionivibrio dicarboxylicus]|uniref:EAL and modified HD-GYP domain-containing signal transduction protein n=1 Tax=Propionivibrio dicarboxylicus TaxID=83767 RepID=A0A1G7WUI1_9RHOO|nr:HDOD domain-containing protein [Propionivibrio dicarboxylicus]SDG75524.1 EAL and modified HD-GYP domain-containing signal transduction protein [Propionivibrio dicarboxylicus]